MSFILHDRNLEQLLVPITIVRGGTSRAFFFEGRDVRPPEHSAWVEVDELTAASYFLRADEVSLQK